MIGSLEITALHTPGHTDESRSYVLADLSSGEDAVMVSAGDALFVGTLAEPTSTVLRSRGNWLGRSVSGISKAGFPKCRVSV